MNQTNTWETFDNKMTKFYWVESLEPNGDLALDIVDGSNDFSCIPRNKKGKVELEIGELRDIIQYTRKALLSTSKANWLRSEIEKLEEVFNSEAFLQMTGKSWSQLDEDGIMVGVSRQAIDETVTALTSIITRYKEELKVLESK